MNKILILGAGIYQVPLIKKAKEMGYEVLACTLPGNYPGIPLVDEVFYVDTTNKEECLTIAKVNSVSAVCTSGTDVALPTLGYIVDSLGLRGPSENAALLSSNKYLMKKALEFSGVSMATFKKVYCIEESIEAANSIGYPCVLKVVDSSGSRGIQIVYSIKELIIAYQSVCKYTKKEYIIVEEFLEGLEFGAQAFVYGGEIYFVMPHSDEVFHGVTGVPVGHTVPLVGDQITAYDDIYHECVKAIRALGIDNSAVNIDLISVNGKPYVLEVGARCGATGLAELVSLHYGVDYYKIILEAALGILDVKKLAELKPLHAATVLLITSRKSGVIKSYTMPSYCPQLYDFSMDYQVGEHVNEFKIGPDRIGQIVVWADNATESRNMAYVLMRQVHLDIEGN